MKLIIDIPEEDYNNIEPFLNGQTIKGGFNLFKALGIIKNGILLDKHDEEIIAETVESIWGKPPYTELLDHIITDLESLREPTEPHLVDYRYHRNDMLDLVLGVIERYRNEVSS